MDPLYNSQRLEAPSLGSGSSGLGVALHTSTKAHPLAPFRNPTPTRVLPLKQATTGLRNLQAEPGPPYAEAASDSLWDSHLLKSCQDSSSSPSPLVQPNRSKIWGTGEFPRRLPGSGSPLDCTDLGYKDLSYFQRETPIVSTVATLGALPLSSTTDTSKRSNLKSNADLGLRGGSSGCTQQTLRVYGQKGGSGDLSWVPTSKSTGTSVGSRLLPSVPALRTKRYLSVSSGAARESASEKLDASSRQRAPSYSALNASNMSSVTGVRNRCFSPLPSAPMSSSVSHLQGSLASSGINAQRSPLREFGLFTADTSLTSMGSSTDLPVRRPLYDSFVGTSDVSDSFGSIASVRHKDAGDSSALLAPMHAESQTFQLCPTLGPNAKDDLSAVPFHQIDRRDLPCAAALASPLRSVGQCGNNARDVRGQEDMENSTILLGSRSIPCPRTERVKAFMGFLKELYIDQDLIPASSVVDCLSTLASYAQGLPAPQGTALPWCCVAGHEIAPTSADTVCLKDRVIVKLVNTLFRSHVLRRAQMSAEPFSDCTNSPESGGGLCKDPIVLVLSCCPSDGVRVSLRASSACSQTAESVAHSLISLGSCSSVALAVSAVETISRLHMPVGSSLPSNSLKAHLCYSPLLRWLWEELCARSEQSKPFDVCTSLIACEACSSSIYSQAECASMLPGPAHLSKWLSACNIDLAALLLLSLVSRRTRHPLIPHLLERTSFILDKCCAVGLAAWLRASASIGLSSLDNPAYFGRVLTAVAAQMPQMPLGTVLADVLWGLTLCGIPARSFFLQAAQGIACSLHMFELEDLCLIGCCYALQMRGFGGLTGDNKRWSYGGHILPLEFLRRTTGLKAYCLLASVKMADTGPTPVLGDAGSTSEATGISTGDGLGGFAMHQLGGDTTGMCTPEELVRAIVDKCQGLRGYISLKACRLLDFTEIIIGNPRSPVTAVLHGSSGCANLGGFSGDGKHGHPAHPRSSSRSTGSAFREPESPSGPRRLYSPPSAGSGVEQSFFSPGEPKPIQVPSTGQNTCRLTSGKFPGFSGCEKRVRPQDCASSGVTGAAVEGQLLADATHAGPEASEDVWGDQYVPAPAVVSALHNYGVQANTKGFVVSKSSQIRSVLLQAIACLSSCASFAVRTLFGYIFIVVVVYAISLWP